MGRKLRASVRHNVLGEAMVAKDMPYYKSGGLKGRRKFRERDEVGCL